MRKIILGVAVLFLAATIREAFLHGLLSNNALFLAGITVAAGLYGWFFERLKKIKWLTATIASAIFLFVCFSVFLAAYGGRATASYDEKVVLVLGGGVRQGEVLSALRMRLDAAVAYHSRNPEAIIIVTGGTGHREPFSEAEAMARYLISRGIPADRILREEAAYSTHSNMTYSMAMLDAHVMPVAVIITNDFHMFRSMRFAEMAGFQARAYPARTPLHNMPFAYMRETAAVVKMWLIGR